MRELLKIGNIDHSLETQPQLKLDSNKIEAENLELTKPAVS